MPYNYGSSGMTGAPSWSTPVSFGGGMPQAQPQGALGSAMAPQMGGGNPMASAINPDILKQLLAQKLKQQQTTQQPTPAQNLSAGVAPV